MTDTLTTIRSRATIAPTSPQTERRELLGASATSFNSYLAQASTDYQPTQTWGYIGFRCARPK